MKSTANPTSTRSYRLISRNILSPSRPERVIPTRIGGNTGLLQSPASLKIQHPTSLQVGMPLVLLPLCFPFLHKGVSEMRILEASQRPRFNQRFKNRHSLDKNTSWGPTSLKCTQTVAVGPTRAYSGRSIPRSDPQPGVGNSPKPP